MKREQAATGMGDLGASARVLGLCSEEHGNALGWPSGAAESKVGAEAEGVRSSGAAAPEECIPLKCSSQLLIKYLCT